MSYMIDLREPLINHRAEYFREIRSQEGCLISCSKWLVPVTMSHNRTSNWRLSLIMCQPNAYTEDEDNIGSCSQIVLMQTRLRNLDSAKRLLHLSFCITRCEIPFTVLVFQRPSFLCCLPIASQPVFKSTNIVKRVCNIMFISTTSTDLTWWDIFTTWYCTKFKNWL